MDEVIRIGPLSLRFLQCGHETGGVLDLFEMTVPPQARMPMPHYHRDWEETVYGLTGVTTWTLDGAAVDLAPGQTLFIPRGTVHGFDNRGAMVATCLCVLTPGVLGPAYFRAMQAAFAAAAPPDGATLRGIMERHGLVPVPG